MTITSRQPKDHDGPPAALLLAGLARLAPLSPKEEELVLAHKAPLRLHRSGAALTGQATGPPRQHLLVSGWAGRLKVSRDGRRQIVSTILPGELYSDPRALAAFATHPVTALTEARCIEITGLVQTVMEQPRGYAGLAVSLTKAMVCEADRLLEHVARLGKCSAYERVGHWLLETRERLEAAGLSSGNRFPMPLTQELIGDALGLSIVHVNRIVQQLRAERLIELKGGYVNLLNRERLATICDYAPAAMFEGDNDSLFPSRPPTPARAMGRYDGSATAAFR